VASTRDRVGGLLCAVSCSPLHVCSAHGPLALRLRLQRLEAVVRKFMRGMLVEGGSLFSTSIRASRISVVALMRVTETVRWIACCSRLHLPLHLLHLFLFLFHSFSLVKSLSLRRPRSFSLLTHPP
jgi:hypothetical protein